VLSPLRIKLQYYFKRRLKASSEHYSPEKSSSNAAFASASTIRFPLREE
jgi:hypothetical protein